LPLKAPADHEPAVPAFVDTVVVSAGLSGLGTPLDGEHVHRPAQFGQLAGLAAGAPVRADALARVLAHPQGGRKGIPSGVRRIALLNQADTAVLQAQAGSIARALADDFDSVLVASIASGIVHTVREPAAAVVLAAGGSSRLGSPKQLLDWGGVPLVSHAAGIALAAGCDPVVVVTGAARTQVRAAVQDLGVIEVFNPDWEAGQSTSVRAGVAALAAERAVGAALFLLVDQPFVEPALLRLLIDTHARSLAPIVAPLIDQRRGNPVLFDRDTFPAFAALAGDAGGRQLFSRFKADWVPWHNALALRDIDTWEDYDELRP
jgi:molybdenum cofactor cytidylyltransferase